MLTRSTSQKNSKYNYRKSKTYNLVKADLGISRTLATVHKNVTIPAAELSSTGWIINPLNDFFNDYRFDPAIKN